MLPIVLHHGLFGTDQIKLGPVKLSYFNRIDRAIVQRGHPLIVTRVHPSSSIVNRAAQLKEIVLQRMAEIGRAGEKVILIGHSMGGLDARYAVTKLALAKHVAAVVTVATPHRGSPVADWAIQTLGQRLRGLELMKLLKLDVAAVADLTTRRCAQFNDDVPDVPGVRYFSVSAAQTAWTKIPPWGLHGWRLINAAEGDNDGLVSIRSAQWGHHLEMWPANHWQTLNRPMVVEIKNRTGDITPYWMRMLDKVCQAMGLMRTAMPAEEFEHERAVLSHGTEPATAVAAARGVVVGRVE